MLVFECLVGRGILVINILVIFLIFIWYLMIISKRVKVIEGYFVRCLECGFEVFLSMYIMMNKGNKEFFVLKMRL